MWRHFTLCIKAWAGRVEGSEGESRVAMRPRVVPLSVGGGVDRRRAGQRPGVAVEAGAHDGCGGGARRGGHRTCWRAGGGRQRQLVVTSRHAVQDLGQVGRSLQYRLLQTRRQPYIRRHWRNFFAPYLCQLGFFLPRCGASSEKMFVIVTSLF